MPLLTDTEANSVALSEWVGLILRLTNASYEAACQSAHTFYDYHRGDYKAFEDRFTRWINGEKL